MIFYHNIKDISQNPKIVNTNFKDKEQKLIDFVDKFLL